jgi:hypothetical protein
MAGVITREQAQVIEQLISDCAGELDSDFYSDGGAVVAGKLYRLASALRINRRRVPGIDIREYVGMDPEDVAEVVGPGKQLSDQERRPRR